MDDVVVDSSVITKWVLPEPDSTQASRLTTSVLAAGGRLLAIDLAFLEVANAIRTRYRRRLIDRAAADSALGDLLACPAKIEAALPFLEDAFQIALGYDLAVYDALFVAFALQRKLRGVTADEPLYNAVHQDFPTIVLLRDWE